MTKEEAIKRLKSFVEVRRKYFDMQTMKDEIECLDMAIKALEEQSSENEQIIRIKKGTLKAKTGRYVIYDVEWLKEHFNTTEAKIYGQPQSEKRTEERTETHECDCISRKGHWIEHKHGAIEHIECSECRCWFLRKDLIRNSYCPNCGSRNHWEWELKMQEVKK